MVGDTEVRLFGIDAPEFDQSCTRNGRPWSCGSALIRATKTLEPQCRQSRNAHWFAA